MSSRVTGLEGAPYISQDAGEVARLVRELEESQKRKGPPMVKKTVFPVEGSPNGISVSSWRMGEGDYKRRTLPTYARGLFTTKNGRNEAEIAIRGYDKFFNVGEVRETKWDFIKSHSQGPYELSLKENGCIIFISGLEDETLLVCSKHSTGERDNTDLSHAIAGQKWVEKQLAVLGRTKQDLARELRARNVTAVAELCDDSFEEHVLAYDAEHSGLYLHGINLNMPNFSTYPSSAVQEFARNWGFKETQVIMMDDVDNLKTFLDKVAETGSYEVRDVEGFVVRCRMSANPELIPYSDWFFKFKFEEPYLMYRQWRECTKAMISGKTPKYSKHAKITEEYLMFARKCLAANPKRGKLYMLNHGIIQLRDEFLASKNLKGVEAANLDDGHFECTADHSVTKDVILVPIATIGCGKTTIALALRHIFGWGHVQNDNISGPKRPPRFTKECLDWLTEQPVVFADRNNAEKRERKQMIVDAKLQKLSVRLVALHFNHDNMKNVRDVTQARVLDRGDNHQTIHAKTDENKFLGIMEGFLNRFEPFALGAAPDTDFDGSIELDPTAESRVNLEKVIAELHRMFPNLVKEIPSAAQMDDAITVALAYLPDLTSHHTNPDRGTKNGGQQKKNHKKKALEYVGIDVAKQNVHGVLEAAFVGRPASESRFWTQLKQTRRVQPAFHVTLMHRATAKEHPEIWDRYSSVLASIVANGLSPHNVGTCGVIMEKVVFDDRIMAIVARLDESSNDQEWKCVNRIAHITIGTRDDSIKPWESNKMLAQWEEEGALGRSDIHEIALEPKQAVSGTVKCVLSL